MAVGCLMAIACSVWVVIMFVLSGGKSLERLDIDLGYLVVLYLVGGAVGGLLTGTLYPITKSLFGAAVVGYLASAPFMLTLALQVGRSWEEVIAGAVAGSLVGAAVGLSLRRDEMKAMRHHG
jgi:hypothetical protein